MTMSGQLPAVPNERLIELKHANRHHASLVVGSPDWFTWLDTATGFVFAAAGETFAAYKDSGTDGVCWMAQYRRGRRVLSAPLGQSEELAIDRLQTVALLLTDRASAARARCGGPSGQTTPANQHRQIQGGRRQGGRLPADILVTKLSPPCLAASLIVRKRVHDRMRQALQRPLAVISAPAGFGKTTAGAPWIVVPTRPAALGWREGVAYR